jgi:hypothetical protein
MGGVTRYGRSHSSRRDPALLAGSGTDEATRNIDRGPRSRHTCDQTSATKPARIANQALIARLSIGVGTITGWARIALTGQQWVNAPSAGDQSCTGSIA